MKRTGAVSLTGLLLAALLYVAVNTLLDLSAPVARIDLTSDRLFTLSAGTHATLAKIDEPIEFDFFFSERLGREVPAYASYERRVRELLVEIATASNGKIILHEHNPAPFSGIEDRAVSLGIQGIPVDQSGELAYFGLAGTNSVDDVELIPFLQPDRERLLEYDLAKMIHTLSNPEPTVVGFMSSLPVLGDMQVQMQGGVSVPWAIAEQLRSAFDVINLPESIDDLPANIEVMAVVHPGALTDRMMYELEQFLFRGGRAVFFIDPKSESDTTVSPSNVSSSSRSIQRLFDKWGVEIPEDRLTGDRSMALRINAGSAQQPVPAEYLVWLGVTRDHMTQDDPVTSQLPLLNLASAGHIKHREDSPLTLAPLLYSTENSAPIAVDDVRGLRPDILGLLDRFRSDDNVYVMGARLSGEVETAFPEGPPPRVIEKPEAQGSLAQLMRSDGPINIIVVADSDLLDDRFWIQKQEFFGREVAQPIAANASFVVNAIGNLAGSDELIGLRSRGVSQRPFERVNAIRQDAERRLQTKERELQEKLKETREKIAKLQGVTTNTDAETGKLSVEIALSSEQRAQVDALRREMLTIRKQLREVQRGLRSDVESLESWLQFANIGLVPLIVTAVAVILGLFRIVRRRRSYATG